MQDYFAQVRQASASGLYFLALGGALVIPDMCSGMEAADGNTTGRLYKAWVDRHVSPHFTVGPSHTPSFSGDDCWGLRCAFLHQGRLLPHSGTYNRVIFVEPNSSGMVLHNNVINDALNIDVPTFVAVIVNAAEQWLTGAQSTTNFRANYPRYMQRYPRGLPPYIVGIPVIA
jgi:hypothetical protein